MNLSLSLTLAEIKEIMEVLKDEIDAVSNDSWYAENASFTLEELRQTFDKVNHGLKVFSPIDFNVLNSCAYIKLLGLGDDVEDDGVHIQLGRRHGGDDHGDG